MLPLFLFTGLAAWRLPDALIPLLGALLIQLSPLWPSAQRDFLRARYRELPLTTSVDRVFAPGGLLARWR
ncbi:MAG: hypothetical protein EXS42_03805 [Lacunisphaera sp.]|nr:hypothetical protein [Lacunisphaera sp.]